MKWKRKIVVFSLPQAESSSIYHHHFIFVGTAMVLLPQLNYVLGWSEVHLV